MKFSRLLFCTKKELASKGSPYFIGLQNQYGCNNYHPLPVVIDHGEGVFVWDVEGNRYFDCLSAYSAVNQGHVHPRILKAFIEQAGKITLTSRAVYTNRLGLLQQKLHGIFGYDKALLMNSGVEAGQSAIKFARRWGYRVKNVPQNSATLLFAKGNFWGRTIAACASSDDPSRYQGFGPFNGLNFELVDYGCTDSLEKKLKENPNIVGFMVEPIQGEKGVVVPPAGYLRKVSKLMKQHNALLICDEIQTGLGRTGKLLCSDHEHVRPDMVLLGKSLSGGFYPISALLCNDSIMNLIKPGEHGSTYGGNPLASSTAIAALDVLLDEKLVQNSKTMGSLLKKHFRSIFTSKRIKEVRGKGLFIGVQFYDDQQDAWEFSMKLIKHGIIAKPTQRNVIRFAPPLTIKETQIDQICGRVEIAWKEYTM